MGGWLGDEVTLDRRVSNLRMGYVLSQAISAARAAPRSRRPASGGLIFDIGRRGAGTDHSTTTANGARAFDRLAASAPIAPSSPRARRPGRGNLLGWLSINVPVRGSPPTVCRCRQLMGTANSEGMLISLAAELEAVSGWATKQPRYGVDELKTPVGWCVGVALPKFFGDLDPQVDRPLCPAGFRSGYAAVPTLLQPAHRR